MEKMNDKITPRIIWGSIITSLFLNLIETVLLAVMQLTKGVFVDFDTSVAGVNPVEVIIEECFFIMLVRVLMGFTLANMTMWIIVTLLHVKFTPLVLCIMNGVILFLMFCVWTPAYNILPKLFNIKTVADLFGVYQCLLFSSLVSPLIILKVKRVPNILPLVTKSQKGFSPEY